MLSSFSHWTAGGNPGGCCSCGCTLEAAGGGSFQVARHNVGEGQSVWGAEGFLWAEVAGGWQCGQPGLPVSPIIYLKASCFCASALPRPKGQPAQAALAHSSLASGFRWGLALINSFKLEFGGNCQSRYSWLAQMNTQNCSGREGGKSSSPMPDQHSPGAPEPASRST